ncbi:hypothetical protein C0J52_04818, partial [Blattella germanica]
DFVFKPEQLEDDKFKDTKNFTLSDCHGSVLFKKGVFKKLTKLENLEITNLKKMVMEPEVFYSLDNLKIDKVEELDFEKSAFTGTSLKTVSISNSKIKILRESSFDNIKDLEKFDLLSVDKIAENGIVIEADQVTLDQSNLKQFKDNAVKLTAKKQLEIFGNELDFGSTNSPLTANAEKVHIKNNHFNFLSNEILSHIHSDKSVTFLNNTIDKYETDEKSQGHAIASWVARDNKFNCTCELLEIFKNTADSQLLKDNFCKDLSLQEAKDKCSQTQTDVTDRQNVPKDKPDDSLNTPKKPTDPVPDDQNVGKDNKDDSPNTPKEPTDPLQNKNQTRSGQKPTKGTQGVTDPSTSSQQQTKTPSPHENPTKLPIAAVTTTKKPTSGAVTNLGSLVWAIMTPLFLISIL